MSSINWDEIDSSDFKSYAREGKHTTTIKEIKIGEPSANSGSRPVIVSFNEDDEYQFSDARYYLSKDKDNQRIKTARNVLVALGVEKNAAQKAVETAEDKTDYEKKCAVYEQVFKRAEAKHAKVEIECWETDRVSEKTGKPYTASGFTTDALAWMNGDSSKPVASSDTITEDDLEVADDISVDDIPF